MVSLHSGISGSDATALSCWWSRRPGAHGGKISLARKSLFLAFAMLSFTGCIVADPPEYQEPRRTPPILDLNHAEPSPYWVVIVYKEENPTYDLVVNVPLRSDDQGERVWFALYVDYKTKNIPLITNLFLEPSTLDDQRSISRQVTFDARVLPGCHQLTLLVAHESSWDHNNQLPRLDAPEGDVAIATWWLNLDPPSTSDPYTLANCPSQSEVQK